MLHYTDRRASVTWAYACVCVRSVCVAAPSSRNGHSLDARIWLALSSLAERGGGGGGGFSFSTETAVTSGKMFSIVAVACLPVNV